MARFEKGHKLTPTGPNSKNWKGDNAGYTAMHNWVYRQLGKPNICMHCFRSDKHRYEWANISGKYLRDTTDWIRLCKKCHMSFDKVGEKNSFTRLSKTHCKRNHEYNATNTLYYNSGKQRVCKLCARSRYLINKGR